MMHGQRLLFAMLLLVLPSQAQSNQALPPNVPDVAGNLIQMQDTNSILVRPRPIVPTGQTLYRWSVAAVLAATVPQAPPTPAHTVSGTEESLLGLQQHLSEKTEASPAPKAAARL